MSTRSISHWLLLPAQFGWIATLRRWISFNATRRSEIYDKLEHYLVHGMPLVDALGEIERQYHRRGGNRMAAAAVVGRWRQGIRDGGLSRFDQLVRGDVPAQDAMIIGAGVRSGDLIKALKTLSYVSGATTKLRAAAFSLVHPLINILTGVAMFVFVSVTVTPAFRELLPADQWHGIALSLAVASDLMSTFLPWVSVAFVAGCLWTVWSLPRLTGPVRVRLDRVGPWALYRRFQGAAFMLSFAGLLAGGVKETDALAAIARRSTPWLAERLWATHRKLLSGRKLGDALADTGFVFPDRDTIDDLTAFQAYRDFEKRIEALARSSVERTVISLQLLSTRAQSSSQAAFFAMQVWFLIGTTAMNDLVSNSALGGGG